MSNTGEPPAEGDAPAHIFVSESLEQADLVDLLAAVRAAVDSGRGVALDCRAAPFLPTGAVQILVAARRTCRDRGLPFAVEGVQDSAAAHVRRAGLGAALES